MTSEVKWEPSSDEYKVKELTLEPRLGTSQIRCASARRDLNLSDLEAHLTFETGLESRFLGAASTGPKKSPVDAEALARRWGIGLDLAKRTLAATT